MRSPVFPILAGASVASALAIGGPDAGRFNASSALSPAERALGEHAVQRVAKRHFGMDGNSQDCFSVDAGLPRNMQWNDLDQFVVVDGKRCRPGLELQDGSCHRHMDLGTRCAAFCQVSAFYFFSEPIDLMNGRMCRYGEGCEIKQEQSFRVEISNTEVDHHVFDTTASVSPSVSWTLGMGSINVPNPFGKRDAPAEAAESADKLPDLVQAAMAAPIVNTGHPFVDRIIREMHRQEVLMAQQSVDLPPLERTAAVNASAPEAPVGGDDDNDDGDDDVDEDDVAEDEDVAEDVDEDAGKNPYDPTINFAVHRKPKTKKTKTRTKVKGTVGSMFGWITGKGKNKGKTTTTGPGGSQGVAVAGSRAGSSPTQTSRVKQDITIPFPEIQSPTFTLAASFSAHWTRDWTRTYHHAVERASFTSITHKQVPGEGCGAFWAVPVGVAYCGWLTVPRLPPAIQEAGLKWLATAPADELYEGTFKLGSWSPDGSHAEGEDYPPPMWNVTSGLCPVNYHEIPFCHAGPLQIPGPLTPSGEPQALHRTVWRPYDCQTGHLLPSHAQPREVREQLDFNEFFKYHARHDPRLFDPQLAWTQRPDNAWDYAE